jgi:dethiobiotin synthetase
MSGTVIAISGIDTGIGKTFVTGLLASALLQQGKKLHRKLSRPAVKGLRKIFSNTAA